MELPDAFADKAARFPECAQGAVLVNLVLADGRTIRSVLLAWGKVIVKVGEQAITDDSELGFTVRDIRDIEPAE